MKNTATALTISNALSIYLLEQKASRHSKRTIEHYETRLRPFVLWLEQQDVEELPLIRPTHIRTYLIESSERGLAQYTVNTIARAIRDFLNFCLHILTPPVSTWKTLTLNTMQPSVQGESSRS
jgi:site-specific recombinase XerD